MKKVVALIGLLLVLVAAFLFDTVFSGGQLAGFTITGTDPTANFIAFLYVITALPIGAGLAYFGLSIRTPDFAAGSSQVVYRGSSRVGSAAIAVAVIALIIGFASIGLLYQNIGSESSNVSTVANQVSTLSSKVSNLASINTPEPTPQAIKVDWCNTDNTAQDRFCPNVIVVNQGAVVQILFMHNDTDAHTFTFDTAPYFFQVNASSAGMRNFLTNENNVGNCSNTGTIAQETAGISGIYCVSGNNLLSLPSLNSTGSRDFAIAQNPTPANPFSNGSAPIILTVDNLVHFNNITATVNPNSTAVEIWGDGAFQATTAGVFEFFCHYHVSNGMFGYLVVLPNAFCGSNPSGCNVTSTKAP
ncbi:MAG: hypothetical protein ACRDF4_07685 [Rhabdochlamydiaceae bacterium]